MNMWDGVCMFFIYASFIEFILVNYLARWVQDPEQQKKKKENAILDVSMAVYLVKFSFSLVLFIGRQTFESLLRVKNNIYIYIGIETKIFKTLEMG